VASRKRVLGRRKSEENQGKEKIKPGIKLTGEREKHMTQSSDVAMNYGAGCCKAHIHQQMKVTVV
jgi:hypothetical protein